MNMTQRALTPAEILTLCAELDACAEVRVDIGGPHRFHRLTDEEITTIIDALHQAVALPGTCEPPKRSLYEKRTIALDWLYAIESCVKQAIDQAEPVLDLTESDIHYLLVYFLLRMLGSGMLSAERSHQLDAFLRNQPFHL